MISDPPKGPVLYINSYRHISVLLYNSSHRKDIMLCIVNFQI